MSDVPSLAADKERQLNELLAEYLEAAEAGKTPDRAALLARHPDFAVELDEFINNLEGLVRSGPSAQEPVAATLAMNAEHHGMSPQPGSRLGDYEILKEIARGGMGVVYRVRHLSLNRDVALKMILGSQQANDHSLRRFRVEAEAVAHLDHPNIVPIYEVGDISGKPYFTMKLVEGGSLSERLHEFQLPHSEQERGPGRAVLAQKGIQLAGLLAAVARAVHHAHQRGILHRDLKPANILLDSEGRPLVADFGLAKRVEGPTHLTQSQTVVGTANYMAPEQAQGNKIPLTTSADVYSLGAILYELLTGRPPFLGDSYLATLIKVVEETPIPPAQCNRFVPADLDAICLKALAKEPEKRYSTARELARDLERWCAGDMISLRSPTIANRAWLWARRNRLAAILLGTTTALMAVVTVGSAVSAWNIAAARDRADANASDAALARDQAQEQAKQAGIARIDAEEQARQARAARDDADRTLKEKQHVLVSSYVANGTHALDGGDVFGALLWYGEALHLDQGDPGREEPHRIRLASVLRRCPKLVQVWFDQEPARSPALSPDGRRVALLQRDSARIWDVASGEAVSPPLRHAGEIERAAFSPDGRRVVTTGADGTACVWDAASGKALTPMLKHDKALHWAAFSRDGASLVTVGADRVARVWDAGTGKLRFELRHDLPVLFASFSADGKRLATCGGDGGMNGNVWVWDLEMKTPTSRPFDHKGVQRWAYLTADGQSVVSVGAQRVAHLWSLASPSKRETRSVAGVHEDPDGAVGRDPTYVLKLDGLTAQVYDIGQGKAIGAPMLHGAEVTLGVFSPDGTRVVTTARDRTARVWDAVTGSPLTPTLRHAGVVRHAAFSNDGRRLLTTTQGGAEVRVWELPSRDAEKPLELASSAGPCELGPEGRLVVGVDDKGAAWVRDIATNKVLHGPWQLPRPITAVCVAHDGRRVVVASEAGARVFDSGTGNAITPILAHTGPVRDLAFTPNSSRVAILGDRDLLKIYDGESGGLQSSAVLPGTGPPGGLLLTPDGRGVAVLPNGKQGIEWRDFSRALLAGPFRYPGLIPSAAFSPDGSRIGIATAEGAFLWDPSARPTAAPLQHGAPLRQLVFSGDSRLVATLAEDNTVRVWDVRSGQPVTPLQRYDKPVVWIGLAADGRRLAVRCKGSHDYVYAWDLTPDSRPADDLVRLIQLITGQAVDSQSGGFEPIEPARLRATWPRLRSKYPQEFTTRGD